MTIEEITKVAKIMLTAHAWCFQCGPGLLVDLMDVFPDHAETIKAIGEDRERLMEVCYSEPYPNAWDVA